MEKSKKISKIKISDVKNSDGYYELCNDLFGHLNSEDEDEEPESNKICRKIFKYGEYGTFEIIVDEDFNIIGGKIIPIGN